jgi:hypothetical protein
MPASFATIGVADMMAIASIGIIVGLLAGLILRSLFAAGPTLSQKVATQIDAFKSLPDNIRVMKLVQLQRQLDGSTDQLADSPAYLYDPDAKVEFDQLEAGLLSIARRRRH